MVQNSKPFRIIKKKRENLDDVIYYEGIAETNDSILRMISLPKEEQLAIFTAYTDRIKAKQLEDIKRKEEIEARRKSAGKNPQAKGNNKNAKLNANPRALPGTNTIKEKSFGNSSFYFYNPTTVAYGKNEFIKIWGERKLQDNWRLSKQRANNSKGNTKKDVVIAAKEEEKFSPEFYLAKLPTKQSEIDSIIREKNYAYYQLGIIYKEKFKEFNLAKSKLETLLENNPETRLILPSKYNLLRIYEALGLNRKADLVKEDIIKNYSQSRYAEILLNPESELSKDKNSPEAIYTRLYKQFSNQEYAEVVAETETQIKRLEGDPIVPKFEILKASAKGRKGVYLR